MSISNKDNLQYLPTRPASLQDIGFCFLKPDYLDIEAPFQYDLEESGLLVIYKNLITLKPNIIDYIYSDSKGEDFYEVMSRGLGRCGILAMVVHKKPDCLDERPAQSILESLKRGSHGYPNLRAKYHRTEHQVPDDDFEVWRDKEHPEQDVITLTITQRNVFHASDGPHDAIGTLLRLRETSPEFFDPKIDLESAKPLVDNVWGMLDGILERHYNEVNMDKIQREWRVINEPPKDDLFIPIRQVYSWILTSDKQVVIVSKDGEHWQLPGGKPNKGEDPTSTAIRETQEETGIDLTEYSKAIRFFGEYIINDHATDTPPVYRQVRSWVQLQESSDDIKLSTCGESRAQNPEDSVRFVRTVPVNEITNWIDWLPRTDEYKALKRNKIID